VKGEVVSIVVVDSVIGVVAASVCLSVKEVSNGGVVRGDSVSVSMVRSMCVVENKVGPTVVVVKGSWYARGVITGESWLSCALLGIVECVDIR